MDLNAYLYCISAYRYRLPIDVLNDQIDGFRVKLGRHSYYFRGGETPFNDGASANVARNKYCINKLLESDGFPVPKITAIKESCYSEKLLKELIEPLSYPLVVKPTLDSSNGKHVLCNINTFKALKEYVELCYAQGVELVNIEEFKGGLKSYRVHVFYGRIIGITERTPAFVIGDGKKTIKELVLEKNKERNRVKDITIGAIDLEEPELCAQLLDLKLTLDSIVQSGKKIKLMHKCNAKYGGFPHSLGAKHICKENKALCLKAAKILELNNVGFDLVCEDLLKPIAKTLGFFIEANHNPDITTHENAISGVKNPISRIIIRRLIWRHPFSYLINMPKTLSIKECFYLKVIVLVGGFVMLTHHFFNK